MLFPKCRLDHSKNFGVEDEEGFAVRREKGLLKGVMHRHLDAVDKVEDVELKKGLRTSAMCAHFS